MVTKMKPFISLEDVLCRIEYADPDEIDAMIDAVQRRYSRLFPDWEVTFLSMPTGSPEARCEQAKQLIAFIQKNYLQK